MNELGKNHSSKSEQTTRVKTHKKQPKKTIGITLPQNLVERARFHKLNISRITNQALTSIVAYLERNNTQRSFFDEASFTKEGSGEGRGRDLNPGAGLHRPVGYQATSPRPFFCSSVQVYDNLRVLSETKTSEI